MAMLARFNQWLAGFAYAEPAVLLIVRAYVAAFFAEAGLGKLADMPAVAAWFLDLGFIYPTLFAWCVVVLELAGAVLLLLGMAARAASLALVGLLVGAIYTVHWANGFAMVADTRAPEIANALAAIHQTLQTAPDYDLWLQYGELAFLTNGAQQATTYLVLLAVVVCFGAGRWAADEVLSVKLSSKQSTTKK